MILIQFRMHPPQFIAPRHTHDTRTPDPTCRTRTLAVSSVRAELAPRLCSRHAGWRATRVRGRGRRGRRGSWRGLSLGVAPGCDAHDVQVHTPCAPPRPRTGPRTLTLGRGPVWPRPAAGPPAHIAAHMMPSRPINPPTGSSRTPLGASSLVPHRRPTTQTTRGNDARRSLGSCHGSCVVVRWSAGGSDRRPRAGSRVPPGAAAQSLLYFSRCVVQGALAPPPEAPQFCAHRDAPWPARGRAEDRVRTERDLWPCW